VAHSDYASKKRTGLRRRIRHGASADLAVEWQGSRGCDNPHTFVVRHDMTFDDVYSVGFEDDLLLQDERLLAFGD
jgi:hypothetical protein